MTPTRQMLREDPSAFMYNVGMTEEEFTELIALIDDDPVDEDLLKGIRRKLVSKRKRLRQKVGRYVQGLDAAADGT